MKLKVLVAALSLSAAIGATAQGSNASLINNEQQRAKVHYPSSWIVKAGAGVAMPIGDFEEKPAVFSYNLLLEYQKQINDFGLFVGGQIGISSAPEWDWDYLYDDEGYHIEDEDGRDLFKTSSTSNFGASIGPVFGLVRPINDKVDFTGHVGALFQTDFDCIMIKPEIGVGCIYGNWMFEIVGAYAYIFDSDSYLPYEYRSYYYDNDGYWSENTVDQYFDLRFNIGYKF
ncbi:MAG: hypothetical protein ACI31C_07820 [Muribaculaceae bacterium]